ncbi:MAG: anti-sigma factor antagonist [Solirubrobacteraceae bacterium]|jgi:anti-anti-sigma factor|nr:anti-sigma factor antagonist [Solirubrobacteraceae bacterium]
MALLELDTDETDGQTRVTLRGELDISSAPVLEEALGKVEEGGPPLLLIDLRQLEFMDSTGLRTVVSADQRAREAGRRLAIVRGPEPVDRIFSVTRLDERLELVDDPAAVA